MALEVITKDAIQVILVDDFNGILLDHHVLLYLFEGGKKLGEVWNGSGKTVKQAVKDRYSDLSSRTSNIIIKRIFIVKKIEGRLKGYDNWIRRYINELNQKGKIPFGALYGSNQTDDENREALINFNDSDEHCDILEKVIKERYGISSYFNTKKPFKYWWGQLDIVERCVDALKGYDKCLLAGHTGLGKTQLSILSVNRYLPNGGNVLITSPMSDTVDGFIDAIDGEYFLGCKRDQKYSYITSDNIGNLQRKEGEVVYIIMTAQDLTYDDIDKRYPELKGNLDLMVVDEGHKHVVGEKTSKRLTFLEEVPTLTLTATPHNIIGNYPKECVIDRSLIWGLKNIDKTKIPQPFIDGINTSFSSVSDRIKSQYTLEEGFNPSKLVECNNGRFTYLSEWIEIDRLFYRDTRSKKKNHLSIVNDTRLSNSKVGLWVLPSGSGDNGAEVYVPRLTTELNSVSNRTYLDSYTISKEAKRNGQTIKDYLRSNYSGEDITILTCGKFTVGTDIPELGHVVLFSKISDVKSFEQLLGRVIRRFDGKDHVGMYICAPDVEIKVTYARMVSESAKINDSDIKEILDSIPLSGYNLEGNLVTYSVEEILSDLQNYYESCSRESIHASSIINTFVDFSDSFWDELDDTGMKKGGLSGYGFGIKLTDDNNSRVHDISTKDRQKTDKVVTTKQQKFASTIKSVMNDCNWISHTTENYDLLKLLKWSKLSDIHPYNHIESVINGVEQNKNLYDNLQGFLNDKREAYSNRPLEEVHESVFINIPEKQDNGLVYTPYELACSFLDENVDRLYNEGKRNFLVLNALSGSFPLAIRNKYPDANIVCAEYHDTFKEYLCKQGFYVVDIEYNKNPRFSSKKLILSESMKFDVVITNPPFNNPKNKTKKGKNGNNTLYIPFIKLGKSVLKSGGVMKYINPPSALTKSTILNQPSPTLSDLMRDGSVENIDYTTESYFPSIGSPICSWTYVDGKKQGKVTIKHPTEDVNGEYDIKDVYYFPHSLEKIEYDLYRKIVDNQDGEPLEVIRSDKKRVLDGTLHTFGYPKVQLGGEGRINFHKKDYPFLSSKLALWLFDYLRRIDGQLSQRQLNGIKIPVNGFDLTDEEMLFLNNGKWRNFSKKDEEQAQ